MEKNIINIDAHVIDDIRTIITRVRNIPIFPRLGDFAHACAKSFVVTSRHKVNKTWKIRA